MNRLGCALGFIASPPFGIALGIVAAIVLWIVLADAGLPEWARILISLMAITAVPGLWFVVLPMWLLIPQVAHIKKPVGHDEWFQEQAKVWEEHHEALGAIVTAPIRSVQAIGQTEETATARMTLLALDLTEPGGTFSIQYALLGSTQPMDEPPVDLVARVEDDLGNRYATSIGIRDYATNGGRCGVAFVPAPPPNARRLRLTIDRLLVFGQAEALDGPWTFDVVLETA